MSDTTETKPEPPKVNHGVFHPQADPLFGTLFKQISANPGNPAPVLGWLATQPIEVVRMAIFRTQIAPWSVAAEPLVNSLTDDQARAVLAAITVGVYQGRMSAQAAQQQR